MNKAYLIVFLSACCGTLLRVGIYSESATALTVARNVEIPLNVYEFGGDSYQEASDKAHEYIRDPLSVHLMGEKLREMFLDLIKDS